MSTQMIKPLRATTDIRCTVVDVVLSNVANHLVFSLSGNWIRGALADALLQRSGFHLRGPVTLVGGTLHIRCRGQGVPFTSVSSDRTLHEAIRSVTEDSGDWLVDQVNGATARWGSARCARTVSRTLRTMRPRSVCRFTTRSATCKR